MVRRETVQRSLVLETVGNLMNHPTADEVYLAIAQHYPSISRTTVYRNLNLLAKEGKINKISCIPADRFDHKTNNHVHLLCASCGKFEDLAYDEFTQIRQEIEAKSSYRLLEENMVFTGICPTCQKV